MRIGQRALSVWFSLRSAASNASRWRRDFQPARVVLQQAGLASHDMHDARFFVAASVSSSVRPRNRSGQPNTLGN